ncbi:hypothetical protein [Mesorhizobium australicum]|uniref:Uncharacterized protein n=1 Tax=Mesorhizobium australicum TaxID=536018 RepID=A0A1X7PCY8_9HYPH|nr:hypothetical protein [Mesorhizobium australicum]SMH49145.1 hypothetical protein SAMN02982922_3867 [Mesorhizobium australicum]
MAEVSYQFLEELLRRLHERMDRFEHSLGEIKHEIVAMRLQNMGMQTDINNIYGVTGRIDQRLDRIENRLELRELAEKPQSPYEPQK